MATFFGTPGNDTLQGTAFVSDTFYGSEGSDRIDGGDGPQQGRNTLTYERLLAGVVVTIFGDEGGGSGTVAKAGGALDRFSAIYGPITATPYDDTITGTAFAGFFLRGEISTRALIGGLGNDTIDGRANFYNLVSYAGSSGVVADLAAGTATGGDGNDTLINVRSIRGSGFADQITGSAAADVIYGGEGNDILIGGDGNDLIFGEGGNDTISGGSGSNTLDGGAGIDTFVVDTPLAALTFRYSTIISAIGSDTVSNFERLQAGGVTYATERGVNPFFYYFLSTDVARAGVDAATHYHTDGWREGRDPNAFFSTLGYRYANPDVFAAGIDPLDHAVNSGWREGRDPSRSFDNETYLARNADVRAAGVNPFLHWLESGRAEGRQAGPAIGPRIDADGFDREWYLLSNLDIARAGIDPKAHYQSAGITEGRFANAYFDTRGYLDAYADVRAAGVDPLLHYVTQGWREGRDPSAAFDTSAYLAANADVAAAGMNPLLHYLVSGHAEGRLVLTDSSFDLI
jgi:hypothetical protein